LSDVFIPDEKDENVPEKTKVIIVGDLHGQLEDLLTIFSKFGLPNNDTCLYIFNEGLRICFVFGVTWINEMILVVKTDAETD
jgi:hypothetical protein